MAYARHKAPPRTRRRPRRADAVVALTGAAMLVVTVIGASSTPRDDPPPNPQAQVVAGAPNAVAPPTDELADLREERQHALLRVGRGAERAADDIALPPIPAPVVAPLPATTTAYTTIAVNVRAGASNGSPVLGVLDPAAEIAVTGRADGGYAEIVHGGQLAWVYAAYVAATPPTSPDPDEDEDESGTGGGVSGAPCPSGSDVESGLSSNAVAVHRAVCALFPGVSAYGGLRPGDGGEHGSGHALDIMVATDLGNSIAAWLQVHHGELGIRELIWRQRIWSSDRAGDGWRWMEDRGSVTANHYDHVHVTVG